VNTSRLETAHSIRNNIDMFLKDELFPRLETLFDEYEFRDEIVRFDELTLNLLVQKGLDFSHLPDEIYRQLKEKIDGHLPFLNKQKNDPAESYKPEKQTVLRISDLQNSGDVFLFFLENGYLPWFGKEEQINSLTQPETWEKSLNDMKFFVQLDHILEANENATDRFILQFPDEIITAFLQRKDLRIHAETSIVLKISKNLDSNGRRIFLKLLIRIAHDDFPGISQMLDHKILGVLKAKNPVAERMAIEQLKKLFQRILPGNEFQDSGLIKKDFLIKGKPTDSNSANKFQNEAFHENLETNKNDTEGKLNPDEFKTEHSIRQKTIPFLEKNDDEIRVQNAGLILLHPFLKPFFASCEITGKHGILSPENFDLAVQTLHFLATGNEDVFEGNLLFEKFLCGVPLKMPVQKKSLLTETIKTEANFLLEEVVRYWPALKNTSADGLREAFIQRDGKLFQEDTKYKLIVERKAQDVLLEKLSWNISVIKLPWISKILFTEW
jgi:hypothetical protein